MLVRTVIVGTKYRGNSAMAALQLMKQGSVITLHAEPTNETDPNAICCHFNGQNIGYIPRGGAQDDINDALRTGAAISGQVYLEAIVRDGRVVQPPKIAVAWDEPA